MLNGRVFSAADYGRAAGVLRRGADRVVGMARPTLIALLLFLALSRPVGAALPPTPPPFSATWQGATVARLSWTQPADTDRACLARIPANGASVALDCYRDIPPGARVVVVVGASGPMDASARPQAKDISRPATS